MQKSFQVDSVCVRVCVCAESVLVSQLMSHGESHWETRVLTDAAAAMGLTHARHMRQTQGLAGHVDGCTDVLPVKTTGEC